MAMMSAEVVQNFFLPWQKKNGIRLGQWELVMKASLFANDVRN